MHVKDERTERAIMCVCLAVVLSVKQLSSGTVALIHTCCSNASNCHSDEFKIPSKLIDLSRRVSVGQVMGSGIVGC